MRQSQRALGEERKKDEMQVDQIIKTTMNAEVQGESAMLQLLVDYVNAEDQS